MNFVVLNIKKKIIKKKKKFKIYIKLLIKINLFIIYILYVIYYRTLKQFIFYNLFFKNRIIWNIKS